MSVIIKSVTKNSLADKYKIKTNDKLISINNHEIFDVLDYRFYQTEKNVTLNILNHKSKEKIIHIKKDEYDEIGLEFDTYLMDKQHCCKNKCIFCFIDQLPKNMRKSLYFKDDDSRLSFLFGNYITLTNLSEHEINRIIKMHISPINISVHTTNPDLRIKMMNNKSAGTSLDLLKKFADANISINCQIVLCPNINDGNELKKTLTDLEKLRPAVNSIAVVPVGLTKYRENLYPLTSYNKKTANNVIDIIEQFDNNITFAADEFYLKAEKLIPDISHYGNLDQLENGVGAIALLKDEFYSALKSVKISNTKNITISIACGTAIKDFISSLVEKTIEKFPFIKCDVFDIKNDFFGHQIDVSGLITGQDLINQLKDKNLGDKLLIPSVMLRREGDMFLDSLTLKDVEKELKTKIKVVPIDGFELLKSILSQDVTYENEVVEYVE